MYPIVKINHSPPTVDTCLRKCLVNQIPLAVAGNEMEDTLHFFTLPNTLDKLNIIQLLQHDTVIYQLGNSSLVKLTSIIGGG